MELRRVILPLLAMASAIVPTVFGAGYVLYDLMEATIVVEDLPYAIPSIALGLAMFVLGLQRFTSGILRGGWALLSGGIAVVSALLGVLAGAILIAEYQIGIGYPDFWILVVGPVATGVLFAFLALEFRWFPAG